MTEPLKPLLDVIMLVNSQYTWAELAIRAVEMHTKMSYRLIIVDQASQHPKMKALLDDCKRRGHTVIHMAENRSFSNGINAGVNAGEGKFICLLNDDAMVTENWDTVIQQDLTDKQIGLVGAKTNYAAGPTGDASWQGEPPYMAFVCVALRRDVWNLVGPMDEENFTGFSAEDLDYCWRVKKAGYKLKVSNCYVLHAGSRSIVANVSAEAIARNDLAGVQAQYNTHNHKYMRVLEEKWGKDFVAQNAKLRQRVLVVSYHAEEQARLQFMQCLQLLRNSAGYEYQYLQIARIPIQMARMLACDVALEPSKAGMSGPPFDYLVQLDDDATFPPETIRKLLGHCKPGVEIVTALAYQRKAPHLPCIFEMNPDGLLGAPCIGWERTGLRKVDVSGFHCSILNLDVIKKMRAAGIVQYFGGFEKMGEDFCFSLNAKKVGVQVYCDTDFIAGHLGSSVLIDEAYVKQYTAQHGGHR